MQEGWHVLADKTYCNPRKTLITDLVSPTYEETRPVKGCVADFSQVGDQGLQVVVIRAKNTFEKTKTEISLTLTDPNAGHANGRRAGILLVLDSSAPITWTLSFLPEQANANVDKYKVVLSPGSTIVENKAEILQYKNLAPDMTDEKFATLVEQNYGYPLSLLAIVENANRISLSLSGKI